MGSLPSSVVTGSRVRYQQQQPSAHVPNICVVSLDEIKERQVQISPAGKLSPASAVEHASGFSVAYTPTSESLWSLPALADLACLFAISEEWTDLPTFTASPAKLNPCSLLDGAFSTARTHIPVRARDLTSEEKELRESAREKELKKFEDYEVKESVLVEAVPPFACRTAILLLWRDTLKRVSVEERIFKSRLCANGSPRFDRRQDVPVSNTTAAHWALRLAFCIAFMFSDFDPLTGFIVGDIENAYLTAFRPASEDDSPTYVRPLPDHPQFLIHLWRLQKAIYSLKDSGFIFEGHNRDRALMKAGWMKSGVPGLWWKWTGKHGAAGSRLIGLCATFVDDLAILGISISLSTFVAEIARKGPFTIKETHPTDEGKVRWAGVDFELKKDEIRIS
uniref:Reverse transcriptase Ty1/copia-type domain-containing protein n=1 Tax=Chromera velia CCMP2878 TaxID=1169474 RepID=A0A0G4GG13_9ALVE|eukprot:Cvel_21731.t1-p1 / transcript=Cvel_21731.t1 / gene=Cvel_21731 / organism=Chromera_velia_CCMP2878 / gene_product=hypothetical protein / transcript_product=hypothetical protein / location=Cvel_scaffold2063:27959-29725(+) / protein_length=392 / sequence_SO=supercontig / SO=protein_coding / is_pseudo=false